MNNMSNIEQNKIIERLEFLSDCVTKGRDSIDRNFHMSIPARPLEDADLVLSTAACLIRDSGKEIAKLRNEVEQLRVEVDQLKGLSAGFAILPPKNGELERYGLRWNGPTEPLCVVMDDGYWTPWHIANESMEASSEIVEQLASKAQRLVDAIENPHPTKYAIQVGMSTGLLGQYLDELKTSAASSSE